MRKLLIAACTLVIMNALCSCATTSSNLSAATPTLRHEIFPRVCKPGTIEGPGAYFAAHVFCDDAVGTSLAVLGIRYGGETGMALWQGKNRFWFEPHWGQDVSEFTFSEDGKKLVVVTNDIYGTGKTYSLDLLSKRATELPAP